MAHPVESGGPSASSYTEKTEQADNTATVPSAPAQAVSNSSAPIASAVHTLPETPIEKKLARVSLTDNPYPAHSLTKNESGKLANGETKTQSIEDKGEKNGEASSMCELPGEGDANFQGEVMTSNELPSEDILNRIGDYIVLDRHGKTHPFKSLYMGNNVARRVLVVFVRHFFCGNCQEYLRTLSAAITPDGLLNLPISTFIAVIGCGAPELIDTYAAQTNCPFPIYTDPTRKLYDELGMVRTLAMGAKPAYIRKSLAHTIATGVMQGLKQVRTGLVTKAGDQRQVGGEFLFEPYTAMMPLDEMPDKDPMGVNRKPSVGFNSLGDGTKKEDVRRERNGVEEKRVSWCHRMRTTRDHAEIPELMDVLGLHDPGLDGKGMEGLDGVDRKRWSKAIEERKGTGLSLAREMGIMNKEMESIEAKAKKRST